MKKRSAVVVVISGLLLLGCVALLYASPKDYVRDAIDFRSFYCAARALNAAHSPYLAEPLRSCEAAATKEVGAQPMTPGLALPAPLPGYAFAPLRVLAKLPYPIANITYDIVLLFATIAGVFLLRDLTELPVWVIIAAVIIGEAFQSLRFGQIVPIVLTLIVLGAALLERERYWLAAAALGAAMIEPHVTAPAVLAVFVFAPRARIALLVVGVFLGAVSCATLGAQQTLLYYHAVVPAQIHAEVRMNSYQFSLTNILHQLGIADSAAVMLGYLSYAIMVALGTAIAVALERRTGRRAFLVFTPCAFSLLGGPYVHLVHIVCAVPLALLLLTFFPQNRLVLGALVLLGSPWLEMARAGGPVAVGLIAAAVAAPIAWFALRRSTVRPWILPLACALIGVAVSLVWQSQPVTHYDARSALLPVQSGALLAEASWERYVNVVLSANEPRYLVAKLPTWGGLLLLTGAAAGLALRTERGEARAPRQITAKQTL